MPAGLIDCRLAGSLVASRRGFCSGSLYGIEDSGNPFSLLWLLEAVTDEGFGRSCSLVGIR